MRRFLTRWQMLRAIGILAAGCAAGAPRAQAATLTVTNLTDNSTVNGCTEANVGNGCSLREAIVAANATPNVADDIIFPSYLSSGYIQLTRVLPDIKGSLSITNSSFNVRPISLLRLNAQGVGNFRILRVNNGTQNGPTVTISGLTISNGYVGYDSTTGSAGGGVLNNGGALTLTNCNISDNAAADSGGGVATEGGMLTLTNCTVTRNTNGQEGGGNGGGGVSNYDGEVTLINTTLSGNYGIIGGGLYSTNAATLTNCTVSGNTGGIAEGGLAITGTNTVSNCTITGNATGANDGGGIDLGSGSTTFSSNIIAGNTKSDVDLYPNVTHNHVSRGYNLVGISDTNALTFFTQ